jgi:cell division protein ZapA (FtsZ GTPase activity inhibitor)|tara:strand:+ start:104 stop:253 length:150 start_codon:yes stop_codon:yes gene_type:complete
MTLMTTISLLSVVFAMVVLSEIFKLKKEVRKLNKITKYILEKNNPGKQE